MSAFALPAGYALLVWWLSTGIILFLDGLRPASFRWSMSGATGVLMVAGLVLYKSLADVSVTGAYAAFTCAILIWGWLEMSFLMGFLTGPRRRPCAERCGGAAHFLHAAQAIIYHEIAIALVAAALLAATWTAPNRVALWTFLVLWSMRLSAKLNLYLGVPNLGDKLLPPHLQYLKGFFRKRTMNLLFPVSVSSATVATTLLVQNYLTASDAFRSASDALLTTLLGLAVLEHWFMVLPLPSERMWQWAMRSRRLERQPAVH